MRDKTKYNLYIASEEWNKKRKEVFKEKGRICEACGATNYLHIHHGTYRRLYKEKISDLFVLCGKCHMELHDKYGTKDLLRATKAFIEGKELIPRKRKTRKSLEQRRKDRELRNKNKLNLVYSTTVNIRLVKHISVTRMNMLLAKRFDEKGYNRLHGRFLKRKNKIYSQRIKTVKY